MEIEGIEYVTLKDLYWALWRAEDSNIESKLKRLFLEQEVIDEIINIFKKDNSNINEK